MAELKDSIAEVGLNLDSTPSQVKRGELSYALNAVLENFDGQSVNYQNEQGLQECAELPEGFKVIGTHYIAEEFLAIYFLSSATSSQIGKVDIRKCKYEKIIDWDCLNFDINFPIQKVHHKKTSIGLEIYWVSKNNPRMYLDILNVPKSIDCNLLRVQPNVNIPRISYLPSTHDGQLVAGTYQFGLQYSSAAGDAMTQVYSVTNPISISNPYAVTQNFDFQTDRAVSLLIENIDTTGVYDYYNLVVIKTINNISSFELVDTYKIKSNAEKIIFTGVSKSPIKLSELDLFEKFPLYTSAGDQTVINDIMVYSDLKTAKRLIYQSIFNKVELMWQSWKLPYKKGENYSKPEHTANLKGFFRDEVYPVEGVFILKDGRETDKFHIPGRRKMATDSELVTTIDVDSNVDECSDVPTSAERWKIYNTATLEGFDKNYDPNDDCYVGPYQYGKLAYYESTDRYDNIPEIYGELAGQPILHPKLPDCLISNIHDDNGNIYPLGFKIDIDQIKALIASSDLSQEEKDNIIGIKILRGNRADNKSVVARGMLYNVGKYNKNGRDVFYPNYNYNDVSKDPFLTISQTDDDSGINEDLQLEGFSTDESKQRFTFHSPDTHFYQPFLGNILKIETIEYGKSRGHFAEVLGHPKYPLLSTGSMAIAVAVSASIGTLSATIGLSNNVFNGTAAFTAFQAILTLLDKIIPRINYAYQYNSVGEYTNTIPVQNTGNKVRYSDIMAYLIPGQSSVGDIHPVNNYQRESSVYIRTRKPLPFTHEVAGPVDNSRFALKSYDCKNDIVERDIASYYATIKKNVPNQYGRLYSYSSVDTGAQFYFTESGSKSIFGGDCFIGKLGIKRKMPFFIDNKVGFPEGADVDYRDLNNVAHANYWFSTDYKSDDAGGVLAFFKQVLGVKVNNFDCKANKLLYQTGKFYLFAYGIPYFFTESEVNLDYRQAYDDKAGDFYPHASSDIPDEWLQERKVPIAQDNTYWYNKSFSKQNKESIFTSIPNDFNILRDAVTVLPNSCIFSEPQIESVAYRKNNWRIYRPSSKFDFAYTHGKLISLEALENRQFLARFENKSLLYNALFTAPTSAGEVYLGKSLFSKDVPPLESVESDIGFNGTRHKFFLRTEYGAVTIDTNRSQIFVMNGSQTTDLSSNNFKLSRFLSENLDFFILKHFPDYPIDNAFNGVGICGAYDSLYSRVLITKLDYEVINKNLTFVNGKFYDNETEVQLGDSRYFCNKSFTLSFSFENKAWVSFHSYTPNYYISVPNTPINGVNNINKTWKHNVLVDKYNNVYNEIVPYIIEYPVFYGGTERVLQSIIDYSKVYKYINRQPFQKDDAYFNKSIIENGQQTSGLLELVYKTPGKLSLINQYPKIKSSSKEILFDKTNNFYSYNSFWNVAKNEKPIFLPSCDMRITNKVLDESSLDYSKKMFSKSPIVGKEVKVRHILDNRDDIKIVSQFLLTEEQTSPL